MMEVLFHFAVHLIVDSVFWPVISIVSVYQFYEYLCSV